MLFAESSELIFQHAVNIHQKTYLLKAVSISLVILQVVVFFNLILKIIKFKEKKKGGSGGEKCEKDRL